MANWAAGQLAPFIGSAGAQRDPLHSATLVSCWSGARLAFSLLGAAGSGAVTGRTYAAGVPARRRVLILTQPPGARLIYEATTDSATGAFAFPRLAPGACMVIDAALDNSRQALVYDWVVVA